MVGKITKKDVEQVFQLAVEEKFFKEEQTYQLDYNSIYGGWQIKAAPRGTGGWRFLLPYRINSRSMYALLLFFNNYQ